MDSEFGIITIIAGGVVIGFLYVVIMNKIRISKQEKKDQERANIKADLETWQLIKDKEQQDLTATTVDKK